MKSVTTLLLLLLLLLSSSLSEEVYNTNPLIARGIDPQILNLSVTLFRQDVGYKMSTTYVEKNAGKEAKGAYRVLYNPFNDYGIDVKVGVNKSELIGWEEHDIRYELDQIMALQSYLQMRELYDETSFKLISSNGNDSVISYTFKKGAIPRELAYMNELDGYVYIKDKSLEKVVLKNTEDFKRNGVDVEEYTKTLYFYKLPAHKGYLLSRITTLAKGDKGGEPYSVTEETNVIEYWDKDKKSIPYQANIAKEDLYDDHEDYVISVKLDRTFPLLGQAARKQGFDLPKAFGITLVNMVQATRFGMESFNVYGSDIDIDSVLDGASTYETLTYAPLLRADMWVLPFISIGAILGTTFDSTDVTLNSKSGMENPLYPITGPEYIVKPGSTLKIDNIETSSLLYGVGATVAGGIGNFFTTIDFQYVTSYTPEANVAVEVFVVTPLVGYNFIEHGLRIFAGAQYQSLDKKLGFDVEIEGEKVSGEIALSQDEWAGVVGTDYSFTRHWSGNILLSYGQDRQNAVLGFTYRW